MSERYSKVPKNIRFDDLTLQLFEKYKVQTGRDVNFSTIVRVGVNSWLQGKLYTDNNKSKGFW